MTDRDNTTPDDDDTLGEAVNPPLPDQGQSDGNNEEATDEVPGPH
jgi:hypothetical protein